MGRRTRWRLALAVWTSMALAPAAVEAGEAVYAISRIVARGGNAILGVEDGVIYEQGFGPGCRPLHVDGPKPFSGSLAERIGIEIEIAACPDTAPPAPVRCTWSVDAAGHFEEVSFTGWKHEIVLPRPKRTGVQSFELSCRLPSASGPTTLDFPFFVTYGEALLMFRRPSPEAWYRFATDWGAGFDARAPENAVVRSIQLGMFAHGQKRWRYGYCRPAEEGDSLCTFPEGPSVPCRDPSLICEFGKCDPGSKCKCSAQATLDPTSPCHFTDCFGFTAILRILSATMGIAGFRDCEICGELDLGFATRPELRSSDPRFGGNLLCGEDGLACRYTFYNHQLTFRDRELFDATFGSVYLEGRQAISLNVVRWAGEDRIFDKRQVGCFLSDGYGTWPFYNQETRVDRTMACRIDSTRPASLADRGPIELELVDVGGRQRVAVGLEVEIHEAGTYRLGGALYAGDVPVVLNSTWRFENSPVLDVVTGETGGRQRARLVFSSEALFEFERPPGERSPCGLVACGTSRVQAGRQVDRLWVALSSERGLVEEHEFALAPLSPSFLEELHGTLPARFIPTTIAGRGVERGDDGRFAALRIEAQVEVYDPVRYSLVGRLAVGDDTVAYAVESLELASGRRTVALRFPGMAIADRNLDGEYRATLELNRIEPRFEPVHSAARRIGGFYAREFR